MNHDWQDSGIRLFWTLVQVAAAWAIVEVSHLDERWVVPLAGAAVAIKEFARAQLSRFGTPSDDSE